MLASPLASNISVPTIVPSSYTTNLTLVGSILVLKSTLI